MLMDENTTATEGSTPAEAVEMLAALRQQVDAAAGDIERLTDELDERSRALDELESVADAVFGAADTPILVVGPDRKVRAVTRGAAEQLGLDGSAVGRPLATVAPEVGEAARERLERLAEEPGLEPGTVAAGRWKVTVEGLGDGGAVLVLRDT
jgi:PAS domain-containing protein